MNVVEDHPARDPLLVHGQRWEENEMIAEDISTDAYTGGEGSIR